MHGAGNDYVYIDCIKDDYPVNLSELAIRIADRHFGVGGDGLVAILPSEEADFRMRMFNADGSEAQMCGNASRCVAKYLYDNRHTEQSTITLETLAGIKTLHLHKDSNGEVNEVTVDMGAPMLDSSSIPVTSEKITLPIEIILSDGTAAVAVGMGNPHGVIFVDEITDALITDKGPQYEIDSVWPEKANIEFMKIIDKHSAEMRVWERGSGETLACGTGACAAAVAGILTKRLTSPVSIVLRGGTLNIEWDGGDSSVRMTGTAATVAHGYYRLPESLLKTPPPFR